MRTEKKVTSKGLSEALRDAGAVQESQWWWCVTEDGVLVELEEKGSGLYITTPLNDGSVYAAFDCAELLERLKCDIDGHRLRIHFGEGEMYKVGFREIIGAFACDPSPAEALGKLYLFCLENGHVTP